MNNGYGFTKGSPEYLEICKQIKLLESLGMTKAECTKTLIDMHGFTRKASNKLVKKVLTKQPWERSDVNHAQGNTPFFSRPPTTR